MSNTNELPKEIWIKQHEKRLSIDKSRMYLNSIPYIRKDIHESEMAIIKKAITELQEKVDENGYDCSPVIKLQRIENHYKTTINYYKSELERVTPKWISVKDLLPAPHENVPVILEDGTKLMGIMDENQQWAVYFIDGRKEEEYYRPVVLWMPLPENPTENKI